jgi:tetratricopeptide (TPR) repeat protein
MAKKRLKRKAEPRVRVSPSLIAGFIVLITLIVYIPSLMNGITNWDDPALVMDNPALQDQSAKGLTSLLIKPAGGNFHPLTMLSYAVNYAISGTQPFSYHLFNLLFHLLNTWLVFQLILLLAKGKWEVAAIAALLFGIHPMHVESVAWIAERKDVLYTSFFLLSLIQYLRYSENGKRAAYLLSIGLFLLSLLSKPAAIILPLILVLIDYFQAKDLINRKLLIEKIPFFALSILFGILTVLVQKASGAVGEESPFSFLQRIMFASYSLISYFVKFFIPFQLSAFHPYPFITESGPPVIHQLAPLGIAAIGGGIWYFFRENRTVLFGLGFFLAGLILVLQLFSFGNAIMADRYTYVPYIGLGFLLGCAYLWVKENSRPDIRRITPIFTALLIAGSIAFAYISYRQIGTWKNSETLWTNVLQHYPNARTAHYNRGLHFDKTGKLDKAIRDYSNAILLKEDYYEALQNRGRSYRLSKQYENALSDFSKAIESDSTRVIAFLNRGNTFGDLERYEESWADFDKVIRLDPTNANGYFGRGFSNFRLNRLQEAIQDFSRAVELNPNMADGYYNRSVTYGNLGDKSRALQDALKAQSLGKPITEEYLQWLKN